MVERGKKFTSLHGTQHREYNGTAQAFATERRVTIEGEEDKFPLQAMTVSRQGIQMISQVEWISSEAES